MNQKLAKVDEATKSQLLEARRPWLHAKARHRENSRACADLMSSGEDAECIATLDRGLPVVRELIDIEDRVSALVLQSAGVILPGESVPLDGFPPVTVELGGGLRCVVKPAVPITEYPMGYGLRRVSFT